MHKRGQYAVTNFVAVTPTAADARQHESALSLISAQLIHSCCANNSKLSSTHAPFQAFHAMTFGAVDAHTPHPKSPRKHLAFRTATSMREPLPDAQNQRKLHADWQLLQGGHVPNSTAPHSYMQ